jgi:hypothetical protein
MPRDRISFSSASGASPLDQLIDHRIADRTADFLRQVIVRRNGHCERDIAAALDYHWRRLTGGTLWMAI